ncbi:hypothetical protein [Hyalangium minutum]|uniref:Uncharacterized protein n=1 Tax=Hyalangium minutum TaxID=394096 RepID=A0A085WUG2_9BACT|nr:hypothetical protein [Hyalangium minutum]KFE71325.1 hypothetical protein DB31_3455 [Hyalangium minutum]
MKRISASWAWGIALAGFLGAAGPSWACDIALWYHVVPKQQQTEVPLNAHVSLLTFKSATRSFAWLREGPNGSVENVPFTLSWKPGDGTHENAELIPESPLAANSRYRIELLQQGGGPITLTSFTTGSSEDGTAPAAPSVTVGKILPYVPQEEASGAECFVETGFARLTASSAGAVTYLLHEGDTLLAAGLPAEASLAFSCPAANRTIRGTLTAVDLAGNRSEPVPVTLEQRCVRESPWGGCSTSGSTGGLVLLALAWVAVMLLCPWLQKHFKSL